MNRNMMRTKPKQRYIWIAVLIIFCLIGIATIMYSTVWGAALSDDSYYYISAARDFLAGKGFGLTAHFPPFLPLVLCLVGIFKVDPLISIRWLNAILFGINIFLVAQILLVLTRSYVFSLLGAAFFLISSTQITIHSWAMSEALFICLVLFAILIYVRTVVTQSWKAPFFTGLLFGLAAATRYIGISFLLAGGVIWLFEAGKGFNLRLRNALIFSGIGVFPLLIWSIRNQIISGQPTSRAFAQHLMPLSTWISMLNTILLWILPGRLVHGKELYWLGGIVLLVIVALSIYLISRRHEKEYALPHITKTIVLLCVSILTYLLILIISRSFFDIRIPMDERLLSPILALGLILSVWIMERMWRSHRWFTYCIVVSFCLLVTITNLTRSVDLVQSYHELGRGYASARDHISETYAYLRNRPNIPVYSNASVGIYFWTGRMTQPIPSSDGVQAMKDEMKRTGGYLVLFDSIPVELYGVTMDELTQGLVEQIRLSEATIYRSP